MQKSIAFFTDTHLGDPAAAKLGIDAYKNLQLVLQDMGIKSFDEAVFGGDITETENYSDFFKMLQNANSCYRVISGNHDSYDNTVKYFKQISSGIDELYYSTDDEAYRYIYMDSSSSKISNAQLQWLSLQLETPKKIIIFIHHPVLGFETAMDKAYPLKNRDSIKDILLSSGQPVTLFCGHYHMKDIRTEGNVTQYITPAVSFQVQKPEYKEVIPFAGKFGYRVIELTDDSMVTYLLLYEDGLFTRIND